MEIKQKLDRNRLYKVELKTLNGCSEYCLVDANDGDEVYFILNDSEIIE